MSLISFIPFLNILASGHTTEGKSQAPILIARLLEAAVIGGVVMYAQSVKMEEQLTSLRTEMQIHVQHIVGDVEENNELIEELRKDFYREYNRGNK